MSTDYTDFHRWSLHTINYFLHVVFPSMFEYICDHSDSQFDIYTYLTKILLH